MKIHASVMQMGRHCTDNAANLCITTLGQIMYECEELNTVYESPHVCGLNTFRTQGHNGNK